MGTQDTVFCIDYLSEPEKSDRYNRQRRDESTE